MLPFKNVATVVSCVSNVKESATVIVPNPNVMSNALYNFLFIVLSGMQESLDIGLEVIIVVIKQLHSVIQLFVIM